MIPRPILHCLSVCAALLAAAAHGAETATATPEAADAGRPSVLLVTFDTTRADHIGAYGYELATTPTIDGLAAGGVLFENAVSAASVTLPSHASILTGTYPTAHGVHDNAVFVLSREAVSVAEVLQQHGYRTAAFVGSSVLDSVFGLDQGFEVYHGPPADQSFRLNAPRRSAAEVVNDAIEWFGGLAPGQPFFVWIHFYDPHQDLLEIDDDGRPIPRPYDAAIARADYQLGRLLRYLAGRELDRRLLTVVTADHGEGRGDHGERTHGIFVYQSVMRVPLIFSGGAWTGWAGERIADDVTNAALAPTLLALVEIPPRAMPDVRLAPLLRAPATPRASGTPGAAAPEPIYLESFAPYYSYRWRALRGVVWKQRKLIDGATPELFALGPDPGELHDQASENPAEVAELKRRLAQLVDTHHPLGWVGTRGVSEQESALLASLGYAARVVGENPLGGSLPDPHERLGDLDLVRDIARAISKWYKEREGAGSAWKRDRLRDEILGPARAMALQLQANHADNPQVALLLGTIEDELGNHQAATPLLEAVVRYHPLDAGGFARLADCYGKAGRSQEAVETMEQAIALQPEQATFHTWLVNHYLDAQDYAAACRALLRFDASLPKDDPDRFELKLWISNTAKQIPEDAGLDAAQCVGGR